MYKLVIFDLDGTILDTLDDLADSTNHILALNNYPTHSKEAIRSFVGNGIYMLIKRALPEDTPGQQIEEIQQQFSQYYKQHCCDKTKPYDGIIDLLHKLKEQSIKLAVVSNKGDFAVKILMEDYFPDLFDYSIGEKENVRKKPAPDSVNEVLKVLAVSKADSVYVGDSEVDIQTAKNAEMACISVSYGFREKQYLIDNGAETICESIAQLSELLLKG
ncbi:MAG: HAD family hydrolase [Erysipelotrichaceae bacterium]